MPDIYELISAKRDRVIDLQKSLTALPALGPENGGQGELQKAAFIEQTLLEAGVENLQKYFAEDNRVQSGFRPNLVVRIPGESPRTLWLFAHMDVVPPGNLSDWANSPWQATIAEDLIFGRGVEDNQQAATSMIILAETILKNKITPRHSLGLVFMADEENGSKFGLQWLLKNEKQIFQPDDFYVVPDGGSADASRIEIAEKAQLWLAVTTRGVQCHASMPASGANALVAASALILRCQQMNQIFSAQDDLFEPPVSTFVPTKHDQNVEAINILPGVDTFYLDCRLLPSLPINDVIGQLRVFANEIEREYNVKIELETVQSNPATKTSPASPVVVLLSSAIKKVYDVKPVLCGIGGATVASFLRQAGYPACVWSCIRNTCHQPNECSSIGATLKDAEVFAHMLMDRFDD